MRHRNTKKALNRPADQRRAMVRNLLTSLFEYGAVKTTEPRAKVLKAEAEKLISKVRSKETYNAIRDLNQVLFVRSSSEKALSYVQKVKRTSGMVRTTKVGHRAGDNALLVQVELLDNNDKA